MCNSARVIFCHNCLLVFLTDACLYLTFILSDLTEDVPFCRVSHEQDGNTTTGSSHRGLPYHIHTPYLSSLIEYLSSGLILVSRTPHTTMLRIAKNLETHFVLHLNSVPRRYPPIDFTGVSISSCIRALKLPGGALVHSFTRSCVASFFYVKKGILRFLQPSF